MIDEQEAGGAAGEAELITHGDKQKLGTKTFFLSWLPNVWAQLLIQRTRMLYKVEQNCNTFGAVK